jgi:hypothetical protein
MRTLVSRVTFKRALFPKKDTSPVFDLSIMSASNPSSAPVECVGSLLVPTSDVQELSERQAAQAKSSSECVGSVIVSSSDMRGVSNLTRRSTTAVGTLLVEEKDLQPSTATEEEQHSNSDSENKEPSLVKRITDTPLARRITKVLEGPPPNDDEPDHWCD